MLSRLANRFGIMIVTPERAVEMHSATLNERALADHLGRLFRQFDVDCVLDVGANRGQYRNFLRDTVGYEGRVVSFEPVSRNVQIMQSAAARDPGWIVHGFALGAQNGHLDINVMKSDDLSSFLAPDTSLVDRFQDLNVVDHTERVEVK